MAEPLPRDMFREILFQFSVPQILNISQSSKMTQTFCNRQFWFDYFKRRLAQDRADLLEDEILRSDSLRVLSFYNYITGGNRLGPLQLQNRLEKLLSFKSFRILDSSLIPSVSKEPWMRGLKRNVLSNFLMFLRKYPQHVDFFVKNANFDVKGILVNDELGSKSKFYRWSTPDQEKEAFQILSSYYLNR